MQGIKIAILVAVAHLSKICAALLIIKLIAVKLGPEGMGLLGNYMSLISIAVVMAGGGVTSGIIKYVSEYSDDEDRREIFIKNSFFYSVFFSCLVFLIFIPFSDEISKQIFGSNEYSLYIKIFLVAQILNGATNFFYGVFNGMGENWMYSLSVFTSNFLFLLIAYFLVEKYGLQGSIVALTLPLLIPLIPALYFFLKKGILIKFSFEGFLNDSLKLSKYTLMLSFSAICFPVVEIFIRRIIFNFSDLSAVGLWQAMMKLSTAYLSFFSIFLSLYLIPRVSLEKNFLQIKAKVIYSMSFVALSFFFIAIIFYIKSDFFIRLIFSESFIEIESYLFYQIAGDFFRVLGWVIGFVVVAKAETTIYIFGEIFQAMCFLIFVGVIINFEPGVEGVVYAYLLGNIVYFTVACFGFFFVYKSRLRRANESNCSGILL